MAEVYALVCPLTGRSRYVGLSTGDAQTRYKCHLSKRAAPAVRAWVASLRPQVPTLVIVADGLTDAEARALERELVVRTGGLLNHALQAPRRKTPHLVRTYPDKNVVVGYDWVKWWKTKVNDELGPFWTAGDI